MNVRLIKKLVKLNEGKNDEKTFYTFSLVLPNGVELRIKPNSYKDSKGANHSNYSDLVLIADDELPFDK